MWDAQYKILYTWSSWELLWLEAQGQVTEYRVMVNRIVAIFFWSLSYRVAISVLDNFMSLCYGER